jgi:hypothetical protein
MNSSDSKDLLGQSLQLKDISIMKNICHICYEDFTSHSFNVICNTVEGGYIFYTKLSIASKYDDTDGIANHFEKYLNTINPKKWTWIIDFDGFGLKHTLGIKTGIRLSKLINSFGRLHYLIIININPFVEQMIKLIKLTLNKEYHDCIKIVNPNDRISKQILEEWQGLDNYKNTLNTLLS